MKQKKYVIKRPATAREICRSLKITNKQIRQAEAILRSIGIDPKPVKKPRRLS